MIREKDFLLLGISQAQVINARESKRFHVQRAGLTASNFLTGLLLYRWANNASVSLSFIRRLTTTLGVFWKAKLTKTYSALFSLTWPFLSTFECRLWIFAFPDKFAFPIPEYVNFKVWIYWQLHLLTGASYGFYGSISVDMDSKFVSARF